MLRLGLVGSVLVGLSWVGLGWYDVQHFKGISGRVCTLEYPGMISEVLTLLKFWIEWVRTQMFCLNIEQSWVWCH